MINKSFLISSAFILFLSWTCFFSVPSSALEKLDTVPDRWYYFVPIDDSNLTSPVTPSFIFSSNNSFTLTVVELWCEGDIYRIDVTDLDTNETSSVMTSEVDFPPEENTTLCEFISNPDEALNSTLHSMGNFSFEPGTYSFDVVPEQEFDLYGALRFDLVGLNETELDEILMNIDPVDECSALDYFVLNEPVDGNNASQLCADASPGAELAAINDTSLLDSGTLLLSCFGVFSRGWIESFNTDDFGDFCLALDAGGGLGPAVIIPPNNCNETYVPFCQFFNSTLADDSTVTI
eukprot:gb/GECH01010977.1/.p1 GENE.gb/GECH01010977.1/~~gb/GECH01010977.1/.p1  ORF type:complete len:292 (+),score=71.30 gb/GECH01010977.1/:1-876(+)